MTPAAPGGEEDSDPDMCYSTEWETSSNGEDDENDEEEEVGKGGSRTSVQRTTKCRE